MRMYLNNSITTCVCKQTGERYGIFLKTKKKIDRCKLEDKKLSNPEDKTPYISDLLSAWWVVFNMRYL